jgi:hypothetical protein
LYIEGRRWYKRRHVDVKVSRRKRKGKENDAAAVMKNKVVRPEFENSR